MSGPLSVQLQAIVILCASALTLACGNVEGEPDANTDPGVLFCADYESTCGFGNSFGGTPYTNQQDCQSRFGELAEARQACAEEHLSFAQASDPATNCPPAEGGAPCDERTTFCDQYSITCGFGNSRGGDSYTDRNDCQTSFDGYLAERQSCVILHLGFASSNPDLHCPHVEGAAPCD